MHSYVPTHVRQRPLALALLIALCAGLLGCACVSLIGGDAPNTLTHDEAGHVDVSATLDNQTVTIRIFFGALIRLPMIYQGRAT